MAICTALISPFILSRWTTTPIESSWVKTILYALLCFANVPFRSFKYKQKEAALPAEDNIVKNSIYLLESLLYVISQGMVSLFYSCTVPFDYSLSIPHNVAKNQIGLGRVLLFAQSPPAAQTNCSAIWQKHAYDPFPSWLSEHLSPLCSSTSNFRDLLNVISLGARGGAASSTIWSSFLQGKE